MKYRRKDRAVIVVINGDTDSQAYSITADLFKKYAYNVDADYLVRYNNSLYRKHSKLCVFPLTKLYEQSLIVNPYVIPTNLSDNIFDHVPPGKWGVIDESHMRAEYQWHIHQNGINEIFKRKGIKPQYIANLASVDILVAPRSTDRMIYEEEESSYYTQDQESAWFTFNLKRTKQEVVWLNQVWNAKSTDPDFIAKYPYAKFINRSFDDPGVHRHLISDINQHCGSINIPEYKPGKYAIVTVDFGIDRFYSHTRSSIVRYAERTGAQLIEITGTYSQDMHACWPKYLAAHVAKDFDKTLYLDTDVYVTENADSIFEHAPDNIWSIVSESSVDRACNSYWDIEYKDCIKRHDLTHYSRWHISNAGVLVIPRNGHEIYHHDEPWRLLNFCDEQTLLNHSLYGKEFHMLDTSWNTMPFIRPNNVIRMYHIAGGSKLSGLSEFTGKNFKSVLLSYGTQNIDAVIMAQRIEKQLIEIVKISHHVYDNKNSFHQYSKYHTVVDDINNHNFDMVINIDVPREFISDKHNNYFINLTNKDQQSNSENSIAIYNFDDAQYHLPIFRDTPTKNGHSYKYLDTDKYIVVINYTPSIMYKCFVEELYETGDYVIIVLNDIGRKWKANYRFDGLSSYNNVLSKADLFIDFKENTLNHHLVYDCVLSNIPVLSDYESEYTTTISEDFIGDISKSISRRRYMDSSLDAVRNKLLSLVDYRSCLSVWQAFIQRYSTVNY
jgi:hypothetical protein